MFEFEVKLEIAKDSQFVLADIPDPQQIDTFRNIEAIDHLLHKFSPQHFSVQEDVYYNHPVWDYKEKNMALRNRKEIFFVCKKDFGKDFGKNSAKNSEENSEKDFKENALKNHSQNHSQNYWQKEKTVSFLTFKNKPLDSGFKLRKEIEFETDDKLWEVLQDNGFTKAATVKKQRWTSHITDTNFNNFTLSFDLVLGLGLYLEIEILLQDKQAHDNAKSFEKQLENFMQVYKLTNYKQEPISYLGLLLNDSC